MNKVKIVIEAEIDDLNDMKYIVDSLQEGMDTGEDYFSFIINKFSWSEEEWIMKKPQLDI